MNKILRLTIGLLLFTIGFISKTYPYTSEYPTQDTDHVKATTTIYNNSAEPWDATDPTKNLTGTYIDNAWVGGIGGESITNQRFHIDLGSGKVITRIYYENSNSSPGTDYGAKNFTFWGSNNAAAFAELTYGTDTNWTQLTISSSQFAQHAAGGGTDPQYITVTNSTSYQYYAFKFADVWGGTDAMCVRRIELQSGSGFAGQTIIIIQNDN